MDKSTHAAWPFVPLGSKVFDTLEIVRAQGAYLYTRDGRKILDASAGAAVGNIGWGRQEVADAASSALAGLTYALPPLATPDRLAAGREADTGLAPRRDARYQFFWQWLGGQ